MFGRFIPREVSFFDYFEKHIEVTRKACQELVDMSHKGLEQDFVRRIKDLEHEADSITHTCIAELHKTFITPFERGDIREMIVLLDDIIDLLDEAVSRIDLYELRHMLPEIVSMGQVLVRSTSAISDALTYLRSLDNIAEIHKKCVEIHQCENDGDAILRSAISRLFKEETDLKKVIQWKEILEHLERATDRCEDVAGVIEGVVMEAS